MHLVRTAIRRSTGTIITVLVLWNLALTIALVHREQTVASASVPPATSTVTLGHDWTIRPSTLMMNGAPDNVLYWGYNVASAGAPREPGYPSFRQSFEQRYRDGTGHLFTEWNLDFLSADGRIRRRPVAVAVELPSLNVGVNGVHINTAHRVSLSLAADDEEFRNADRTRLRLAINDAGIGIGADPGANRDEAKVMVYRRADTNALFELHSALAGERVWQWRYGAGVGAPSGSVAFYNATDRVVGPVVLRDGAVETGATGRFRYKEPFLRVAQQATQAIPPGTETIVQFAGSARSLRAPAAGNYALVGGVVSADGTRMVVRIRVNGIRVAADKGTILGVYRLAAGDTVTLVTEQTSSQVQYTSGDAQTFLSIIYVGE
jgi:hypothetical protein